MRDDGYSQGGMLEEIRRCADVLMTWETPEAVSVSNSAGTEAKPQKHLDHISEKGNVSEFQYGMAHKPIAVKDAMTFPDARAAVDREWGSLPNRVAWDFNKIKPESEVVPQVKKNGRFVHFASFMDLWHLNRSELANGLQTDTGRVMLWGVTSKTTVDTEQYGARSISFRSGWKILA